MYNLNNYFMNVNKLSKNLPFILNNKHYIIEQ